MYCGQNTVDLDHIFNSIMVVADDEAVPDNYLPLTGLNKPEVTMIKGRHQVKRQLTFYAVYDHSLMADYAEKFQGATLTSLRIQRVIDGTFALTVRGNMSDYIVATLDEKAGRALYKNLDAGVQRIVDRNPDILTSASDVSSLWESSWEVSVA